jgi:N-acetylmuramoyl-L-alanine amidase
VTDLPVRKGDVGESVRDIQRRLGALGFEVAPDPAGSYLEGTDRAVRAFQEHRGLRVDGICGRQTWASLVEAGYRLGDRFLYHRTPMLRGDDVSELQRLLGALGFDAGRVDGMFGAHTASALKDFQRNAGLTTDGISGPDTVAELQRLSTRSNPTATVARVREEEALRQAPRGLMGRRLAVGETGGLAALCDALGSALIDAGAVVMVLHHPDESVQASEANRFDAEAFLSLALLEGPGRRAAYYAADGFESVGGRRLAALVIEELPADVLGGSADVVGMRLPILRETRMPAVVCEVGPASAVVEHGRELTDALARSLLKWVVSPVEV